MIMGEKANWAWDGRGCCAPLVQVALGVSLLLCVATAARAQQPAAPEPASDYEALTHAAVEEYALGHWEEARALFLQAHALQPSARTFRGLGMAAFEARQYVDALRFLTAALADQRKPLTPTQRRELESLVQRARSFVVRLQLELQPADAEVSIDGQPVESGVNPVLLDAGSHQLIARADGYHEAVRVVQGSAGSEVTLRIHLSPEARGADSLAAPDGSMGDGADASRGTRFGTLKWVALGASGVAAVTAGVAWGLRHGAVMRWNDERCLAYGSTRAVECRDEREAITRWQTVSLIGAAAGGALAGLTVALFLLDVPSESTVGQVARACASGVGELGIACTVAF